MKTRRKGVAFFVFACLLFAALLTESVFAGENIGKVVGMVFDAQTKEVIEGAKITVEKKGEFKEEKKPVVTTKSGEYLAQADLGASSSEFSIKALLLSSSVSFLLNPGSVTKRERSIDVDSMNVKIEKEGYKTFTGTVPIYESGITKNQVVISPVFLAKNELPYASFVQTKFMDGKKLAVSVTPDKISLQEKKTKLHTVVKIPRLPFAIKPPLKIIATMDNFRQKARWYDGTGFLTKPIKEIGLKKDQDEVAFDFNVDKRFLQEGSAAVYAILSDGENSVLEGETAVVFVSSTDMPESVSFYRDAILSFEDREKAISLLKSAVQSASAYLPATKELAAFSLEESPLDAAGILETALPQFQEDVSLKLLYAYVLLAEKQTQKAREVLDAIKSAKLTPGKKAQKEKLLRDASLVENNMEVYVGHLDLSREDEMGIAKKKGFKSKRLFFKNKGYRETQEDKLLDAVQKKPQSESAWVALGDYYSDKADDSEEAVSESMQKFHQIHLDKAQWAYEKSLELKQENAETLFKLGKIYFQRDDLTKAMEIFEKALEIKKAGGEIKEWLGLTFYTLGEGEKAKDVLEEAGKQPKVFYTPYLLGVMAYKAGDKEAANKHWARALSMGREKAGGIRFGRKKNLANYAVNLDPACFGGCVIFNQGQWGFYKGFVYDEAQNVVNVVESESVLKNHPDNFLALYHLGDGLTQMGLVDEAIAALNQCVTINSEAQDCLLALGKAYAVKGDAAQAKDALSKLVTLNPYHPEAPVLLASLYEKDKQFNEAKTALENYLTYYTDDEGAKLALGNVNAEIEQEKLKASETVEPVKPKGEKKKEVKKKPVTTKKKETGKKKGTTKNKTKAKIKK